MRDVTKRFEEVRALKQRPPAVVKGQKEECQHRFVDLVRVERHPPTLPVSFELRWGSWPHALMSVVNPLWAQLSGQRRMAWVDELCRIPCGGGGEAPRRR